MSFTRQTLDLSAEQDLITGLIMDDRVCADIIPILNLDLLQNKNHQIIAKWIIEYYELYLKAPQQTIQSIFETNRKYLSATDSQLISDTLTLLSNRYEKLDFTNIQFLVDRSKNYIEEREIRRRLDEAAVLLDKGDLRQSRNVLFGITSPAYKSAPFQPLEQGYATKIISKIDDQKLFSLHGQVGELLGQFRRKWLVAFIGPAKRGKTYQLLNIVHTALQNNLNVYYASLEMDEEEDLTRFYQMLTKSTRDDSTEIIIPVFDCYKNQDGSCPKHERQNDITLLVEDKNGKLIQPEYRSGMRYKVCTYCRNLNLDYQEAVWFKTISPRKFSLQQVEKHNQQFRIHHGNNFYMNTYPKFEATLNDIFADIDYLGVTSGWHPDVLVIDYADILRPVDTRYSDPRDSVNDMWKAMSREAGKRKLCLFTATQGNRSSFRQSSLDEDAMSEDIRKLANVNVMISINQTPAEKQQGVLRLALMAHRHRDFNPYRQAKVLYNLQMGAVNLDSQIITMGKL